jgi:hypothetical protein
MIAAGCAWNKWQGKGKDFDPSLLDRGALYPVMRAITYRQKR